MLQGEPLEHGSAGEVNPAQIIHLDHHHHHLVADVDYVLGTADGDLRQVTQADQTFLPRQYLHKGAEGGEACRLAGVYLAQLHLFGQAFDDGDRLLRLLLVWRADEHRAVVLDVDGAAGLLDDGADHAATGADDGADLLLGDGQAVHARGEGGELRSHLGDGLQHLAQYEAAGLPGLGKGALHDLYRDPLNLDVHLKGGYALLRAGHLEVHVAHGVFQAGDVGEDAQMLVALDEAHGHPGHRGFDGNASVHQGEGVTADAGHRGTAVAGQHFGNEADGVGELLLIRYHGQESTLRQGAVADVAAGGPP